MALTYAESATLMQDQDFRGRIKVAALAYAEYIFGEDPNTTAHNSRYQWSQRCLSSPDMVATNIQPAVVMEDQVQAQGAAISDTDLSAAVQITVNKMI